MPSKGDFISDGYALEHRVVGYLESNGWFPIKSHMSKGIVDVIGVKPGGDILFVQCKLSEYDGKEFDELVELNERFEEATVNYATLTESNKLEFKNIEELQGEFDSGYDSKYDDNCVEIYDYIEKNTSPNGENLSIRKTRAKMCERLGITDEAFDEYLEKLKREGQLFEPAQGEICTI